jgi:hypothetical protein
LITRTLMAMFGKTSMATMVSTTYRLRWRAYGVWSASEVVPVAEQRGHELRWRGHARCAYCLMRDS